MSSSSVIIAGHHAGTEDGRGMGGESPEEKGATDPVEKVAVRGAWE
jgi:hypothetical protein